MLLVSFTAIDCAKRLVCLNSSGVSKTARKEGRIFRLSIPLIMNLKTLEASTEKKLWQQRWRIMKIPMLNFFDNVLVPNSNNIFQVSRLRPFLAIVGGGNYEDESDFEKAPPPSNEELFVQLLEQKTDMKVKNESIHFYRNFDFLLLWWNIVDQLKYRSLLIIPSENFKSTLA